MEVEEVEAAEKLEEEAIDVLAVKADTDAADICAG